MAKILFKRGLSGNISSIVLAAGEPAFTTDTKKLFIGDGNGNNILINIDVTDVGLEIQTKVLDRMGVPDGFATLDVAGKVPLAQLPDALVGNVQFMGTWNPATNTPELPSVPEVKGQYWVTSAAGDRFGLSFQTGDWIIADTGGTGGALRWGIVKNTDAVRTVQGRIGDVVITAADVGLGNVNNTADEDKSVASAAVLTTARTIALSGGATGTATSFNGSANITISVTGLNMSNANAGILTVERGGTGAGSLTGILKGNGTGAITSAEAGTDYLTPDSVIDGGTF